MSKRYSIDIENLILRTHYIDGYCEIRIKKTLLPFRCQ